MLHLFVKVIIDSILQAMYKNVILLACLMAFCNTVLGQYQFSGQVDKSQWQGNVYLSLVEDYRKVEGIHSEQIINSAPTDSLGFFTLKGNNLPEQSRIYKLHIDNCDTSQNTARHFLGHCEYSVEIPFIASANDTLHFPGSFDSQTFCTVISSNEKNRALLKIDSLKEAFAFDLSSTTSATAKQLNARKWMNQFKNYSKNTGDPLAQLYTYTFISNRAGYLYPYYIEDLINGSFYAALEEQLQQKYPDAPYTQQYQSELNADRTLVNTSEMVQTSPWMYVLLGLGFVSVLFNIIFIRRLRKTKLDKQQKRESLTAQEQKIVTAILENKSNKEIAAAMHVSLSTVKTHINNIYKKLGISSREELKSLF